MARIQYTSSWDFLVRYLVGIPLLISFLYLVGGAIDQALGYIPWISEGVKEAAAVIGGIIGGGWIFSSFILPELSILASWLYLRLSIWVPANWLDAEKLAPLFMTSESGIWYPIKEVRKYPKKERLEIAYAIAMKVGRLNTSVDAGRSPTTPRIKNPRLRIGLLILGTTLAGVGLIKLAYDKWIFQEDTLKTPTHRLSGNNVKNRFPANLPITGLYRNFSTSEEIAPLTIRTSNSGRHYFVKLVDFLTDETVMTMFIRSGQTINTHVPLGIYEIRYATGEAWSGDIELFGSETQYSKADKTFQFSRTSDGVAGYSVELIAQPNGNLKTKSVSPNEW